MILFPYLLFVLHRIHIYLGQADDNYFNKNQDILKKCL